MIGTRRTLEWRILGGLVLALAAAPARGADELGRLRRGAPLPAYRLVTLDGGVSTNPRPGRAAVIAFLAVRQRDSELVATEADRLVKKYDPGTVELQYVTTDAAERRALQGFREERGLEAPFGIDGGRELSNGLGVVELPTTIVVDPEGRLAHVITGRGPDFVPLLDAYVRHASGALDDDGLREEIRSRSLDLLTGTRVPRDDRLRRLGLGDEVPAFSLSTASDGTLDSAELRGRVVVLVYLSSGQRSSDRAAVDAHEVVGALETDEVVLACVTADVGRRGHFGELWRERGLTAPLAFDPDRALYGALGLVAFPTTLVIDREGRLAHVVTTRRTSYPRVLDAFVRHALGRIEDAALDDALRARSQAVASPEALVARHRAVARLFREKGLLDGARSELEQALAVAPRDVRARLDLADLHLEADEPERALALADTVLEDEARNRRALLLRGIALAALDRLDEAESALTDSLVLNPSPARARYHLGRVYEAQGRADEALEQYRRALRRVIDE